MKKQKAQGIAATIATISLGILLWQTDSLNKLPENITGIILPATAIISSIAYLIFSSQEPTQR